MNKKTLNALNKSIQKWERFATGTAKAKDTIYAESCPLCKLFLDTSNFFDSCDGCPVAVKTHRPQCHQSPYYEAKGFFIGLGKDSAKFKSAARREASFLKSLLPKGGAK